MGEHPTGGYTSHMRALPVVIDTDPGIDDLVALTLALRSPELDVVGLTTSYGNAELDRTTSNLRSLLALLQRERVPIFPGGDRPLTRPLITASDTHGPTGVGHAPVGPSEPLRPDRLALCRALEAAGEAVTLITLGPLTNLALALQADADLVRRRVRQHIGMFGSLSTPARRDRWADFNAWSDPDAAAAVLGSELDTTMVGLDVTSRVVLAADRVAVLRTQADPAEAWLGQALEFAVERDRHRGLADGCRVHDVLPVAAVVEPALLTLAERRIRVDLDEGPHRGRTVEAEDGVAITVAVDADLSRTRTLLHRVVPGLPTQ